MTTQQQVTPVPAVGVFAAIKLVLVTVCQVLMGLCTVCNKTVGSLDDIATVANINTNQMVRESKINAEAQILALSQAPDLTRS